VASRGILLMFHGSSDRGMFMRVFAMASDYGRQDRWTTPRPARVAPALRVCYTNMRIDTVDTFYDSPFDVTEPMDELTERFASITDAPGRYLVPPGTFLCQATPRDLAHTTRFEDRPLWLDAVAQAASRLLADLRIRPATPGLSTRAVGGALPINARPLLVDGVSVDPSVIEVSTRGVDVFLSSVSTLPDTDPMPGRPASRPSTVIDVLDGMERTALGGVATDTGRLSERVRVLLWNTDRLIQASAMAHSLLPPVPEGTELDVRPAMVSGPRVDATATVHMLMHAMCMAGAVQATVFSGQGMRLLLPSAEAVAVATQALELVLAMASPPNEGPSSPLKAVSMAEWALAAAGSLSAR